MVLLQILCKFCANEGRAKLAWALPSAAKIMETRAEPSLLELCRV